jgi:serine/threonine protein kinase
MKSNRWNQVEQIFHEALQRQPEQRAAFLAQTCAGDETLLSEVNSLLNANGQDDSFFEVSASTLAAEMFGSLVGETIGPYEVLSELGSGGMGTVYLAQDARLGRKIALKLLPPQFTNDKDRLRRFQQEARAASALNHPNILTVYEIEQKADIHYIATEYVDGVTLRQLLSTDQLELDRILSIATQIASALQAAHAAGIVHRDIKPENVMIRSDGYIKVLDFGLAKLTENEFAGTTSETNPGVVLGTPRYMSPEQSRGLDVDLRTDIFSLGTVIYEMVTGKVPFEGETTSDVIAAIIKDEPQPMSLSVPELPPEFEEVVNKALAKDLGHRYQTIAEFSFDLQRLKEGVQLNALVRSTSEGSTKRHTASRFGSTAPQVQQKIDPLSTTASTRWAISAALGLVLIGVLLIAFVGYFIKPRTITTPPPLIALPLTSDPGFEGMPSLSPDGNYVAFIAGCDEPEKDFDLYVKQIGGGPPSRLTSGPAVEQFPAWSPDNRSIAFVRPKGDKLEVLLISPFGGPERKLTEITADTSTSFFSWVPPYLSWTPDSKYLVTMDRLSPEEPYGLFILSVATGEKRRLTTPPATATADGNPAISPDGRALAFLRIVAAGLNTQVCVLPLSENYRPAGEVRHLDLPQQFLTSPTWTSDGREIVYSASEPWVSGETRLWRVSVSGVERPQPLATVGENGFQATISRQGHRLVYADWKYDPDIWRAELYGPGKSSPAVKLIASTHRDVSPQYSADGSRIAFASDRSGHAEIWMCNSDGSSPVQVTTLETFSGSPQWFPDGRRIVFDLHREGQSDIYVTDLESQVPRRLTNDPSDDTTPNVSHDGKWIYFSSKRTGRFEIWRMPAEGGEAAQVTHNGGLIPFESADGRVIYYAKAPGETEVWKVPVSGGDETKVLGPVSTFEFAVVADGIYFIEIGTPLYVGSRGSSLKFFSFTTGLTEKVSDVKLNPNGALSISPDRRYALMTMVDPFICDLKLVENFR